MSALLYEQPAKEWEEALPLGNGRMGAMVYGGAGNEHIQLRAAGTAAEWTGIIRIRLKICRR